MDGKIKRRRLGRTELMVTELSFGAMNLRLLKSFDEARTIVNHVLDQGVNLIDTARAYKGEIATGVILESEQVVGEVVRSRPCLDEPLVLVTKGHAYTIPALEQDLAESLKTLGISGRGTLKLGPQEVRLIYLVHGISQERWATVKASGVLDRLQELKRDGVISHIGFSSHYPFAAQIKEAIDSGVFDVAELPYNIFNRSLGEDGPLDLLAYAHRQDIGLINMKAFNGNGMVPIYQVMREHIPIDYPAMLRFCLSNPAIATVDAGVRVPAEFDLDRQAAQAEPLPAAEREALKAEADKIAGLMKNVCRECMHCQEKFSCPHQIDFPRILSLYARYRFMTRQGKDTADLARQYRLLVPNGDDCVACGECMPWCEYRLDIPMLLKEAHQVLSKP
ncbi:MAG: hypothetical protein GX112_03660 [Clostridiaceae bacterium]|jgi:predicted aldo/keto reductase-like oxidoreductase|nr:hypothetical protein [Clostridiaceae bacterium]